MRCIRKGVALLVGLSLLAGVVGCRGRSAGAKGGKGQASLARAGTGESKESRPAPGGGAGPAVRPVEKLPARAAKDLKVPAGLSAPVTEMKLPRSGWQSYEGARVGDLAEYELPGAKMTSRMEVFDLADHAVVTLMDVSIDAGGKVTKSRSAMKLLFVKDEPDRSAEKKAATVRFVRRPANRKFTVDGREVTADTLLESWEGDRLVGRTWQSREMPSAVLQTEDGTGKATMRLVRYRRGR